MNPDLTKQLTEKYPQLFADLPRGPECGDGWFNILMALGDSLTNSYSTSMDLTLDGIPRAPDSIRWDDPELDHYFWKYQGVPEGVRFLQIKQKFGSLRVYHHIQFDPAFVAKAEKYPKTAEMIVCRQTNYIDGIIRMAEAMSTRTCEITGVPGEMHVSGGWLKTLSPAAAWLTGGDYRPYSEVLAERENEQKQDKP